MLNKITNTSRYGSRQARRIALVAFVVLLLASSAARLLTFQRYLPYMDYNDEGNTYVLARNWQGLENDQVINNLMVGYPPLYVWTSVGVQQAVDATSGKLWLSAPDYLRALRLLSAPLGIITTAFVIATASQLAGPIAGWFAGLVWAIAPVVVENNNYAIADPFVYLGCAIALACAVRALHRRAPIWVIISIIGGMVAVYAKYSAVYALLPGGFVGLVLLVQEPRRFWKWALAAIALVAVAFGYLFLVAGALNLNIHEAQTFRSQGLANALDLSRNTNNWMAALLGIGSNVFFVVLALAAVAWIFSLTRRWRIAPLAETVMILVPYSVLGIIISASITNAWAQKMRHVLPITLSLSILWGVCIAQIAWTAAQSWRRSPRSSQWRRLLAPAAVVVVVAVIAGQPMLVGTAELAHDFTMTDSRTLLRHWTDVNLPTDGLILMNMTGDLERTWNRDWGGYDGVKTFQWWFTNDPMQLTPQQYYQRDITYFAMSQHDRQTLYNLPGIDAWLSKLLLLKTISPSDQVAGPTVHFYRMLPPQTTIHASFGGQIALVGYDLNAQAFHPGDALSLRPYWRIEKPPASNYSMFAHLVPDGSQQQIAQHDGPPTVEARPTLTWDDPDELYMGDLNTLTIPASAAPGRYHLQIGLYDFNTGERLTLPDGTDSLSILVTLYTGATTTF